MHVYGEPAGQTVKDAWGGQRMLWHAMLAQQGYIVASVDTRGTPAPKGRDWRKAVYRQLGIMNSRRGSRCRAQAAASALPSSIPNASASGVGAVVAAAAGCDFPLSRPLQYRHRRRSRGGSPLYDSIYEERYMGLPKDNAGWLPSSAPPSPTRSSSFEGNLAAHPWHRR
jgi:dipeptidyl-peptidase-4